FAETPSDAGVFFDAYAVASNGVIRRYNIGAGTYEDVYTIGARWPAASANSFWQGCFSGVAAYGSKLIYNDADSFYSFDPASGNTEKIYTPEIDDSLNIYGCYNFGDTLYYVTGPKSNVGDSENRTLNSVEFSEIFRPQVPEYTVRFVDWDGTVISEAVYEDGESITVPEDPADWSDETYDHTFTGWSPQVSGTAAGDATYTAQYGSSYIEYTVSFLDWDMTAVDVLTLHYGDDIAVPGDPQRGPDETYTYTFSGWDKQSPEKCEGSATYTAVYSETYRDYTVKFLDWDGSVISEKNYHYGDTVEIPDDPQRAPDEEHRYVFSGWDKEPPAVCAGSAEYTATYAFADDVYIIIFADYDGTVIATRLCTEGEIPQAPGSVLREADETYTYSFTGWDSDIVPACGDATYTAVYLETYIDYTVQFIDWDGGVINEKNYHYGDTVEIPGAPEREADETYTYSFSGWDKQPSQTCAGDATYTAVYGSEEKPQQPQYMRGDVNGNGRIDAADYAMCKRAFLKTFTLSAEQLLRADINGNGKVDASEYAMIKRHFLGTYRIPQPGEAA
ncbi:MAG: dockerin type I repeat-containing protein, partial [Clostridia bacterium]|nr:dockerin type I repeat-containing protein [Clostridia bacterium]